MANWNPKIPLDWRTLLLCVAAGMALSLPVGGLLPWIIFEPPTSLFQLYIGAVGVSWIVLLVCGLCCLCGYPRPSPVELFALVAIVFILIALLRPAINGSRVY